MNVLERKYFNTIKISLKFVPKGPINNMPTLVQIMAWRRLGDKQLFEPMMVSLLTHICVTRPQTKQPMGCRPSDPVEHRTVAVTQCVHCVIRTMRQQSHIWYIEPRYTWWLLTAWRLGTKVSAASLMTNAAQCTSSIPQNDVSHGVDI